MKFDALHLKGRVVILSSNLAGVDCDVSIGSSNAIFKAKVFRALAQRERRFGDMLRLIKAWAGVRGLNSAVDGTFNSFALGLMVRPVNFCGHAVEYSGPHRVRPGKLRMRRPLLSSGPDDLLKRLLIGRRALMSLDALRGPNVQPVRVQLIFHLQTSNPPVLPPLHELFQDSCSAISSRPIHAGKDITWHKLEVSLSGVTPPGDRPLYVQLSRDCDGAN